MRHRGEPLRGTIGLLGAAAEAHPNWEVVYDETGSPYGVGRKHHGKGPRTPRGLERWFVSNFPDAARRASSFEDGIGARLN